MKTIALNDDNQIEIKFNDKGQPIDEESVKPSSFLGPLEREIVPFKMAKNEEERMGLKPNNIKRLVNGKSLWNGKLGSKFKKKKTRKWVVSRVEVWIEAHKKKNGEPINTKTTEAIIVKTIPHKIKCKLLDWSGSTKVVAERCFSSEDPKALVHHVPIGPNAMGV
ncbi:hypothetical protein Patl1_28530 [Pistacia atlantica]|uniref:Uncharacterized protein n=1 Tax=Pistacia atlantica TaxID=434234 RepID=A0ACC1BG67_9ROSI|nr:hypothetical protein Patl1_28530 [Pistacia atlantica]